jgi:hypothetical protein
MDDQVRISLPDARDYVRRALFGDHCIELTAEQFDLIQMYRVKDKRCPPSVARRADKAWVLRDQMDEQLRQADVWLRNNGFDYPVEVVRSLSGSSIKPISFGRAKLYSAVASVLGDAVPPPRRFSGTDIDTFIRAYFDRAGRRSQRGCENELRDTGRLFDRDDFRKRYNAGAAEKGKRLNRGRPRN